MNRSIRLKIIKNCTSRFALLALFVSLFVLQGCSSSNIKGVLPEKAFKPNKQQAVVLISTSLDAGLKKINGIKVIPHLSPSREVFAFYVDKNKHFKLKSMTFSTTEGNKTIEFNRAKGLPILHSGIYFYGNLYKKEKMIFLDYLQHPKTMEYASYRYSRVFKKLHPINFDY